MCRSSDKFGLSAREVEIDRPSGDPAGVENLGDSSASYPVALHQGRGGGGESIAYTHGCNIPIGLLPWRFIHTPNGIPTRLARPLVRPKGNMTIQTTTWKDTPTRTVDVDGTAFAYRELGAGVGVPVVFLHHLMAVLDDWDPRIIEGIAAHHHVITFDNRGVGATGSTVPPTVEQMGADAIAFIRALGYQKVDLFGFSLGGGVAQMVALQAPELVRRMILAGTGPRGAGGIERISVITAIAYIKAALTFSDARNFLFFPRTGEGKRAGTDYFRRLRERTSDLDKKISMQARVAQLKAIRQAGLSRPDDLSAITSPVFVANGDHDLMVDSSHSADMARRLPDATLKIYPHSGHGGVFQHHEAFVPDAVAFLADK